MTKARKRVKHSSEEGLGQRTDHSGYDKDMALRWDKHHHGNEDKEGRMTNPETLFNKYNRTWSVFGSEI